MSNALLIVDVQNGFINEKTKHIPMLVEKLQYDYNFVIVTRFINLPDSPYRKLIKWEHLSPETDEVELAFKPKEGAVIIDKYIYSCIDERFMLLLKGNGIDAVDICGIDTDICVTKCAVDLFERNITPYVLKDYCATHADADIQEAALVILARYIGKSQII
ncbi:MAG: cysteine hydrolase [Bacteroidales bacterium]|nr:cysteine hydrolase [Bacteroidales bacterium]